MITEPALDVDCDHRRLWLQVLFTQVITLDDDMDVYSSIVPTYRGALSWSRRQLVLRMSATDCAEVSLSFSVDADV